ncbi:hypothetical protein BS78_03G099500 [Paspalum vaginatum]|nr:hypothetical protein BS78_03G099500 [Paspalum vaginatum]
MATTATNRRVILKEYVEGYPREEHMELVPGGEVPLRQTGGEPAGSVLVRNLYLSCDPYMRPKMSRPLRESYTAAFVPGQVITGYGVARVVDSSDPRFAAGDLVWGITGWEDYSVVTPPASKLLAKVSHRPPRRRRRRRAALLLHGRPRHAGPHRVRGLPRDLRAQGGRGGVRLRRVGRRGAAGGPVREARGVPRRRPRRVRGEGGTLGGWARQHR